VPAATLSTLVRTPVTSGQPTVVQEAPDIAGIVRLRATQVPIIYVFFKHKLEGIPKEPVGLYGSELSLAFTDISQAWRDEPAFEGRTVLAVSASDASGLPGTTSFADAEAMLQELAEFLPFRPGTRWGESPDIDWTHTKYESNADSQLFINQTGTDAWRPETSSGHISNIYLAGDFCNNNIGMTTIESAVTTGLKAARVIVRRNGYGDPVRIIPPPRNRVFDLGYVWLRYAWAPSVAAASLWSHAWSLVKDGCGHRSRNGLLWARRPGGDGSEGRRWF
jgi:Flavin containing amine oxidoreductase